MRSQLSTLTDQQTSSCFEPATATWWSGRRSRVPDGLAMERRGGGNWKAPTAYAPRTAPLAPIPGDLKAAKRIAKRLLRRVLDLAADLVRDLVDLLLGLDQAGLGPRRPLGGPALAQRRLPAGSAWCASIA